MDASWLPDLVEFNDYGNWERYLEAIHDYFAADFIRSTPTWPGKRFGLKKHPEYDGKSATFWHMISEGSTEADRTPDFRRCERIRWPRATIDAFEDRRPESEDRIVWWKNKRGNNRNILLALPDFAYLVVMADRGEYILPWTAYPVERAHQRAKLERDYHAYWKQHSL